MLRSILFWFIRFLPASLRHKIYLRLKKYSVKWYGRTTFFAQRLPFGLYIKHGHNVSQEVLAIQHVSKHTSIPVPQVLDVVENCFIMTRMEGDVLGDLFSEMSSDEVSQVRRELGKVIQQLHSIPGNRTGVVSGPLPELPCEDVNRIDESEFGPFADTTAFHKFLLERIPPRVPLRETYALAHIGRPPEPTVFTHGDLHLRNILVQRHPSVVSSGAGTTVRVSGIIDWTCAGWYPSYWEHGKATYVHRTFKQWTDMWMGIAEDVIVKNEEEKQKYMDELALEKKIWQYID
ncbi:kinase-like protein [Agrocybe pediades]|nr:kinase-like protein [Agrocybe pediades]